MTTLLSDAPVDGLAGFVDQLAELDARQLRRQRRVVESVNGPRLRVDGREVLAFCSNDYLGLAQHPALIEAAQQAAAEYGVGATASPLVCGHQTPHELLEQELAEFAGRPRALYFGSGYVANVGLVPALVGRGDAVFCDALNHACLIDGTRLSGAERHIYPHNDVATLAVQLAASSGRRKLVVTDAVFSMDGDIAPLAELLALCEKHGAWLMIDDAHGFGVLGEHGRGSAAHFGLQSPRLIYMATLGKAAGVSGAFVAGEDAVVEWLLQRARSYIFATATPAMVAQAVRAALKVVARDDWRREHLAKLIARLRQGTTGLPWRHVESPTAIQPLIIGENAGAMAAMAALQEQGLWVPAIRPPTVPEGTARLRISLSALHTEADIDRLIDALHRVAKATA
jgi:8-amino-7-oxononanoate synthase